MKLTVGEGVPPYAGQILRALQLRLAAQHNFALENRHHAHMPLNKLVDDAWDAIHALSQAVESDDSDAFEAAARLLKTIIVLLDVKKSMTAKEPVNV